MSQTSVEPEIPIGGKRNLKVVHCPSSVAGAAQAMAKYERSIGLDSKCYIYFPHPFGYNGDQSVTIFRGGNPVCWLFRLLQLIRDIWQCDVIHFNFGHSLLPSTLNTHFDTGVRRWLKIVFNVIYSPFELVDLKIYRLLGKKLLMVYQGSDARQEQYCLANHSITFAAEFPHYNPVTDRQKQVRIGKVNQWVDYIWTVNPDLMGVLPGTAKFHPYGNVPVDSNEPKYRDVGEKVRILHAPSHRSAKGSEKVLQVLRELENEGVPFELVLVEGVTHRELMDEVAKVDLVIDQILSGWYGGFSVEAMSLGKPVICYLREEDLNYIPEQMKDELPFINVTPDTLKEALRLYLTVKKSGLREIGEHSRRFVERWHCPVRLAEERKAIYESLIEEHE